MAANDLLRDSISKLLPRLAAPSVIGITAIIMFQVVDIYFVGLIGTEALAAISYTFPVTFFLLNILMGISVGAAQVIGRLAGEGQRDILMQRATDAVLFGIAFTLVASFVGYQLLDEIFLALGAEHRILELVREYMQVWFWGVAILAVPIVGNGAMRGLGDTVSPAWVMIVAGLVNMVLDPILIFGWFGIEPMGIRGAIVASLISWVLASSAWFYIAINKHAMLDFRQVSWRRFRESVTVVMRVGGPAAVTNVLNPAALAILTKIASDYGPTAVAALGIGQRVESLAMVGFYGLSTAVIPVVAQNLGAGLCDRLYETAAYMLKASVAYGMLIATLMYVLAVPIAELFSDDLHVVGMAAAYLEVVPFAYFAFGAALLVGSFLNGTGPQRHCGYRYCDTAAIHRRTICLHRSLHARR